MTVIVMVRRWLVLWLVVIGATRADAKMMIHYDLAGLLVHAEAVVIADRVGPAPGGDGATRYRVTRSLRGSLARGAVVDIYDQHFETRGHTLEPRAVLFLSSHDGKLHLVPSGLRVISAGKVWRFEQRDNPGPYRMIPQGKDPQEQWGLGGAQLDLAGLEAAIATAGRRVDALAAAIALRDPAKRRAAVLAVFPRGSPGGGFYVDELARRGVTGLVAAGDLEGALLVESRDRGVRFVHVDYAKPAELVAIARDAARSTEVRVAALEVMQHGFRLVDDLASIRAAAALIDDPVPEIRAAAIATAAHPAQVSTSDQAAQRKLVALGAEVRALVAKRYLREQDPRVLAASLEVYQDVFRKPPPARGGGPRVVALASLGDSYVRAEVYCVRPSRITRSELIAKTASGARHKPAFSISVHCGGSVSTGGLADGTALPAGRYELVAELSIAGAPRTELAIGTLVVEASGERWLAR